MSDMPELEGGEAPAVEEAPAAPEAAAEQPAEMPLGEAPVEKRKRRVSIYWKRPKSHLYEYNFGNVLIHGIENL